MAKKKDVVNSEISNLSREKLKEYLEECERKYKESFKGDSCKAIMDAYHEREWARKCYYKSTGIKETKDEDESFNEELNE